jgi:hypothetical protein
MASFKNGDRVRVITRDIKPEDEKNGLYYSYFGGLTGSVDCVYDDGSVCVDVDLDSLSEAARDRHLAMQEAEKTKWLEGLSGEARGRLTAEQKQLKLSYKILTSVNDIEHFKGDKPTGGKRGSKSTDTDLQEADSSDSKKSAAKKQEPRAAPPSSSEDSTQSEESPGGKRLSADDLAKAEEEYFKSLQDRTK